MSSIPLLSAENISKQFGSQSLLQSVSLSVQSGEIHAIMGRSGAGKTTFLKILAGLVAVDSGKVLFNGDPLENPEEVLVPGYEELAYMAQDFRLLKNRTVDENLKDALLAFNSDFSQEQREKLLHLMRLTDIKTKRIELLSGGEKQRLAIARAMATLPDVLLLDEPFTQLDKATRQVLMDALKEMNAEFSTAIIFVTHDVSEAFYLADIIHFLEEGQIIQSGASRQIYKQPANAKVANLIGLFNIVSGEVLAKSASGVEKFSETKSYGIWPEKIKLKSSASAEIKLDATVKAITFMSSYFLVKVVIASLISENTHSKDRDIMYLNMREFEAKVGNSISLFIDKADLIELDR